MVYSKIPPHVNYYEGVLQLRDCNDKVRDFVFKETKKNGLVFITKEMKVKGGIDLFLTDQRFLRQLGKKLTHSFTGELVESRSIFTRDHQSSRDVYRVTMCFRLLPFQRGKVIVYKGEKYKVMSLGKHITLKHEKDGSRLLLKADQLQKKFIQTDVSSDVDNE